MTALDVLTEPLGGSPLARALLSGALPAEWLPARPATPALWRERAELVRADFAGDAWLEALRPALGAGGAAGSRLARAAEAGGVVVTTGQQPGLFGGPIYTWSKALSALALADALEASTGRPTAPVFWAATDDADFAEASWTAIAVPGGHEVLRMAEPERVGAPMAQVPLGDVASLLAAIERGVGSASYGHVLEIARESYHAGATVGGAYVALLRALLEPLGIAVLDASHPAVRRAAAPLLREALRRGEAVDRQLRDRGAAIARAGFEPQVAEVPGLSLVSAIDEGGKRRVPLREAQALARDAAVDALGPNVLLRPVVERALLPTVAYVAGPGELAYFAQVGAVAEALDAAAPLAVPRWSGTIIEPHVRRLLARYDLAPADLDDPHAAETRLARATVPPTVTAAIDEMRAAIARLGARLRDASERGDAPMPDAVVSGAERQLAHKLERLERRYVAAAKRRADALMHDLGTLRGCLQPGGQRQERALNFLPLLARHGPALLDAMRERAGEHAAVLSGAAATHRPSAVGTRA